MPDDGAEGTVAAAFSPDGRLLAAAINNRTVRLYAIRGEQIEELDGSPLPTGVVHLSARDRVQPARRPAGDRERRRHRLGPGLEPAREHGERTGPSLLQTGHEPTSVSFAGGGGLLVAAEPAGGAISVFAVDDRPPLTRRRVTVANRIDIDARSGGLPTVDASLTIGAPGSRVSDLVADSRSRRVLRQTLGAFGAFPFADGDFGLGSASSAPRRRLEIANGWATVSFAARGRFGSRPTRFGRWKVAQDDGELLLDTSHACVPPGTDVTVTVAVKGAKLVSDDPVPDSLGAETAVWRFRGPAFGSRCRSACGPTRRPGGSWRPSRGGRRSPRCSRPC